MEKKDVKANENDKSIEVKTAESQEEVVEEAYFFHPLQFSKSEEVLKAEEIEKHKVELEQKLQELLKSISEETLQLSEFLMEEDKLIKDLCMSMKQILKKLNVSFNIPPREIPIKAKVKKVILNEECNLILVYEKGEVHSAFLAEYPPEIVMATLMVIMPELAEVIMLYRKKISTRVSLFARIKKELKSVVKAIVGSKEVETSEKESMDVVEDSLQNENQES
ncbi:MAG: hypothetical protein QXJ07_04140 [Candidatus Bathyarchaeia archaeon]